MLKYSLSYKTTVKTGVLLTHILGSNEDNEVVKKFKNAYNNSSNNIRQKMNDIYSDIAAGGREMYVFRVHEIVISANH